MIRRVLRPGGTLGLLWNHSDPSCEWDVACHRVAHPAVGDGDHTTDSADELPGFTFEGLTTHPWHETISREHYVRRWQTVSTFLAAEPAEHARMTAAVERVLDADPETRGRPALELPQVTDVFVYRRA